jgi:hypothetical protein
MFNWYHHLRRFVGRAAAALSRRPGRRRATVRVKVEALEERQVLSSLPPLSFELTFTPGTFINEIVISEAESTPAFRLYRNKLAGEHAIEGVLDVVGGSGVDLPVRLEDHGHKIIIKLKDNFFSIATGGAYVGTIFPAEHHHHHHQPGNGNGGFNGLGGGIAGFGGGLGGLVGGFG